MAKPASTASGSQPAQYMTYEQFLEWADEDTHAEWVDGEVVVMNSPANLSHQLIMQFLEHLMTQFAVVHDQGIVLLPPFQMKLARSGREPDLIFVAKAHLGAMKNTYLQGPADLVVEIVSPESETRDRVQKFDEYRAAGVPEYWLIDPQVLGAEFYQLDAQGAYQQMLPDATGVYHSRSLPGFWLDVSWLWQDPLPDVVATLLRVDPKAYGEYLRDQLRQAGQG